MISDKETIDKLNEYILVYDNRIKEQEYMISHYKSEIDKYQNDNNLTREVFLAEPDKMNLELYNELNYSRDLIAKLSKILNQEKTNITNLENKLRDAEEKIINMKKGKKIAKNMDKISALDYISSDDDVDATSRSDDLYVLESPIFKFEEKIKMQKKVYNVVGGLNLNKLSGDKNNNLNSNKPNLNVNNSVTMSLSIPKLDLTNVKAKYHNPKNIEIAEVNNIKTKISNRSTNEYIDKLKFQLKTFNNEIKATKKKLEKYKKVFHVQKITIDKLKAKNEILESQLKKCTPSTNDDTSTNKKDMNTSMVGVNWLYLYIVRYC